MAQNVSRLRQVVDWRAVTWAGLGSGVFSLLVNSVLTFNILGNAWVFLLMTGAILMGEDVLAPPMAFNAGAVLVGLLLHLLFSVAFTAVIAGVWHRWGILVGVAGGAIIGLAIYIINIYSLSFLFPWFYSLRNWMMLASHVVFGAVAGGLYEVLEVERFEVVED